MPLRIRKQHRLGRRQVLSFQGEVNGSTACQALEALAQAAPEADELVLDFSALTAVEAFGLEILGRGLRRLAHGRRIRIEAPPRFFPVISSLVESVSADCLA